MRFWLVCTLLATACGTEDDLGPRTVRVFAPAPNAPRNYRFVDEELATLESARHVRGGASKLRGGGSLVLEEALFSGQLTANTEEQVRRYKLVTGDAAVRAQYEHDGDVLVPLDWETLQMFTFYRHMERARAYYGSIGVLDEALPVLRAYFDIRLTSMLLVWGQPLVTDNEAYTPIADSFLLFPSRLLGDGVPLEMNVGVVTHELSHAVKHHMLHGDSRLPLYVRDNWPKEAVSSYRADDEGLADFFASVFTDDPDFISPSLPSIDLDRDVSVDRHFTQEQFDDLKKNVLTFDPYSLGSSFASWLWDTAGSTRSERLAFAAVVQGALRDLADQIDSTYRITKLMSLILARSPTDVHDRGCNLLIERLEGDFRDVAACGISSSP